MKNEVEVYQIIDANLNRAREGARVVEEVFRFIKKEAATSSQLKEFRHKILKTSQKFSVGIEKIKSARNIETDPGKDSFTESEKEKNDIKDIVIANWQRVQEALRVLEEFSKLIDTKVSFKFKKLRFEAYQIEKSLIKQL